MAALALGFVNFVNVMLRAPVEPITAAIEGLAATARMLTVMNTDHILLSFWK